MILCNICDVLARSESFMTSVNANILRYLFISFVLAAKFIWFMNKWLNVHKSSKNKESYLKTHMPLTLYRDYHMPTNGRQTVI